MSDHKIPRSKDNDYTHDSAAARRSFVTGRTGASLSHVGQFSVPPESVSGNCENFMGVTQMPVGVAGPLLVNGEHASGEYYIPLATTEGTLIASYNRGMRAITQSGGIRTTVFDDYMQRAPALKFSSAREIKHFMEWFDANYKQIKAEAESTSSIASLEFVQRWPVHNSLYMRWNYSTGDAAGQNMVSKATDHACLWILKNYPGEIQYYAFSGGMDTDKKHSHINNLYSRGKRVVAELVLKKDVIENLLRTSASAIQNIRNISSQGSLLAGASYTGGHSANGIAAFFIATGQDEANVAEAITGFTYVELLENKDLYWSITLPSLVVATYGGGTGLATQREALEIMDCYGTGKVEKLIEIIGGAILAGEISLSSAVVSDEWVESHDKHGRNRP